MVTELVTFKMERSFLKDVDKILKSAGFQNRTEFIRTALREKIEEIKLKHAMYVVGKQRGKSGKNITDAQLRKAREEVSRKLLAEYEKRVK